MGITCQLPYRVLQHRYALCLVTRGPPGEHRPKAMSDPTRIRRRIFCPGVLLGHEPLAVRVRERSPVGASGVTGGGFR